MLESMKLKVLLISRCCLITDKRGERFVAPSLNREGASHAQLLHAAAERITKLAAVPWDDICSLLRSWDKASLKDVRPLPGMTEAVVSRINARRAKVVSVKL